MAKVDGSLKSLLQGVSQQPPRDRLPGQATAMNNMTADPVAGLSRRPPTDLVTRLPSMEDLKSFHNFETKDGFKWLAMFYESTCAIVDYNGLAATITIDPAVEDYLTASLNFSFATIENQVIVASTNIIPAMTNARRRFSNVYTTFPLGFNGSPQGIVQVLGGAYGREYRITMDGTVVARYRPPDGSEAPMVDFIRTSHIAQRLFESMTTTGANEPDIDGAGSLLVHTGAYDGPNWTVVRKEDIILITRGTSTKFGLACSDDMGGVNLKVMTEQVPDTADLPRIAPQGYLVRVATETDPEEDLFLEFVVERWESGVNVGSGFGKSGFWQESTKSDIDYEIDVATMPIILEYDPDTAEFELRPGTWKNRQVGTDVSNPVPSFIGNTINDVTTFQSRLVFLSGSYVSMSRTNRYDDFWMGSASQLVDTDPVDISSTAVEVSVMRAAIPNNRDLVVFSNKGQFIVFGRSALTPANATLVLSTAFEAELNAKPVPAGRNVFFATNHGRFTGVREFYTEGNTDINDTRPITQHVKEYMLGRVARLIASSNYDMLLVQTTQETNTVYVYQYIWQDNEKVQAAWHKWIMPDSVEFTFFDEELIYFITKDGADNYNLIRMSLDVYPNSGIEYPVYLDMRFDVPDLYTAFFLPYPELRFYPLVVVQGEDCPNPGMTVPITEIELHPDQDTYPGQYVARLKYDLGGGSAVVGASYLSEYRPTMPFVKDKDGVVVGTAKLKVRQFLISLNNTGHIIGKLLSKYGDGEPVEFQGRIVGAIENVVGVTSISEEQFVMPFREQTDRADYIVYTDRHLPMTLLEIEYVGQYSKSGTRITQGG